MKNVAALPFPIGLRKGQPHLRDAREVLPQGGETPRCRETRRHYYVLERLLIRIRCKKREAVMQNDRHLHQRSALQPRSMVGLSVVFYKAEDLGSIASDAEQVPGLQ